MEISLVAALLGGALALLSPCGALLLPAFFASQASSGLRLLANGGIFFAGISVVLVPLGVGAGALGRLLVEYRAEIVIGTSILLIVMGIAQAFGWGFDLARAIPGSRALQARASKGSGMVRTFLLGIVGGIAGFCAGPILGAVLTLAAAQGNPAGGGILLAVYSAGMVVPLVVIAAVWKRIGKTGQRRLRGRVFTALGREWHSTSVITGVLMVALGVIFWVTNGMVGLPELVSLDAQASLQNAVANLGGPIVDIALVLVAATVAIGLWLRYQRKRDAREADGAPSEPGPVNASAREEAP